MGAAFKKGGEKPVDIDLTSFKRKSIAKKVSEEELAEQMRKIEEMEKQLQQYKHYQDFDRLSYNTLIQLSTLQQSRQNNVFFSLAAGFVVTKYLTNFVHSCYTSGAAVRRYYPAVVFTILVLWESILLVSPLNHPINSRKFKMNENEVEAYRALDEKFDLFKYVDDIKYNFDYSNTNISELKKQYYEGFHKFYDEEIMRVLRENYVPLAKQNQQKQ